MTASPKKSADELIQSLETFDFDSFADVESRRRALAASRALTRRLETPVDTMWQMAYIYPALYSALKVALDQDVFTKLGAEGDPPRTTADLSGSADQNMIRRLLRHIASASILKQDGPDLWAATRHTDALRRPEVYACIDYAYDISVPAYMHLPHYLKKAGYPDPADVTDGNWQSLTGDSQTHFGWLAAHPDAEKTFWNVMQGYSGQGGSWVDVYPTEEIMRTAEPEGILVVDVGGATGHDMEAFVRKHPDAAGRLVFQDQPKAIADAEGQREKGLTPMVHDFFTPQPITGAKAYFMHWILHDWPDDDGRRLLENVKSAMKRGYSRLLLSEIVIPSTNATVHQTSLDLMMAALVSAKERSEQQWEDFLRPIGFRVIKFWHNFAVHESIVEAELI